MKIRVHVLCPASLDTKIERYNELSDLTEKKSKFVSCQPISLDLGAPRVGRVSQVIKPWASGGSYPLGENPVYRFPSSCQETGQIDGGKAQPQKLKPNVRREVPIFSICFVCLWFLCTPAGMFHRRTAILRYNSSISLAYSNWHLKGVQEVVPGGKNAWSARMRTWGEIFEIHPKSTRGQARVPINPAR